MVGLQIQRTIHLTLHLHSSCIQQISSKGLFPTINLISKLILYCLLVLIHHLISLNNLCILYQILKIKAHQIMILIFKDVANSRVLRCRMANTTKIRIWRLIDLGYSRTTIKKLMSLTLTPISLTRRE